MLADVCRTPITTINVDEGPAYGAAILASVAAGLHGSVPEACDAVIADVAEQAPDGERAAAYARWYAENGAAYAALAPGFQRAATLLG